MEELNKIEQMINRIKDKGNLKAYNLSLYDYNELLICYNQIKILGRTTTINRNVMALFESVKGLEIKTHKNKIGWLIKLKR